MKSSGTALVLAAVLCLPATGRAADVPIAAPAPAAASLPTPETVVEVSPARHTGFRTLLRDVAGDFAHLPSRDSLFIAAIGGGAALAVHPADATFNQHLETTSLLKAGDRLGNTFTLMGATFAVYGAGRATGSNRVTHVAMDLVRAQIVSEGIVHALKPVVRRERPDGSDHSSFPSGHASVVFAATAVLDRHLAFKWALPAYGLAAYVSASRLHDNVHYLSDVVMGAAVGTIAGRTVTRHGPSSFAFMPVVVPGGAAFVVVRSRRDS